MVDYFLLLEKQTTKVFALFIARYTICRLSFRQLLYSFNSHRQAILFCKCHACNEIVPMPVTDVPFAPRPSKQYWNEFTQFGSFVILL